MLNSMENQPKIRQKSTTRCKQQRTKKYPKLNLKINQKSIKNGLKIVQKWSPERHPRPSEHRTPPENHPRASWTRLGVLLGASWRAWRLSWRVCSPLGRRLGRLLEPSRRYLDPLGPPPAPLGEPLDLFWGTSGVQKGGGGAKMRMCVLQL